MMVAHALPETPCLLLDLDAFERNVGQMVRTIVTEGRKQWRPHVKAIRAPAIALRLLAAGASGVTCATVGEAATMVGAGVRDVLIASNVVRSGQLRQLAELNRIARVAVSADAPAHLQRLASAAHRAGVVIPVAVEVDVGLQRSGVAPGHAAVALARMVHAQAGLSLCGLMAWEGHTTRIADASAKQQAVAAAVGQLVDTARMCMAAGIPVGMVSCSGTGTYSITSRLEGVTELQAGGGVFGDLRYRHEFHVALEPALTLRATVLSRPTERRLVCNAGWRYLGVYPTLSQPLDLPGVVHSAPSAEHLTFDCDRDMNGFAVGDPVDLAVGYADSTVALHTHLYGMRNGALEQTFVLPQPVG